MSLVDGASNEILVVDDDAEVCDALSMTFTLEGYQVATFLDGTSFAPSIRKRSPACVLLDVCMAGRSGLDILDDLDAGSYCAPIIMMSGRADIPMAVAAIKHGAYDFIEKRLGPDAIFALVREAIGRWPPQRRRLSDARAALPRSYPGFDRLSPRERDVLHEIMSGASTKQAAKNLGTSWRTVENQRQHIMQKLGARNSMDLARIVLS
jgi:two-component system, LuxR family, response regulator FixJ